MMERFYNIQEQYIQSTNIIMLHEKLIPRKQYYANLLKKKGKNKDPIQ